MRTNKHDSPSKLGIPAWGKKIPLFILLIAFIFNSTGFALASPSMASDYLFETGRKLYQIGRYSEALLEFRKVLLIEPDHAGALKYIAMISGTRAEQTPPQPIPIQDKESAMEQAMAFQEAIAGLEASAAEVHPAASKAVPPKASGSDTKTSVKNSQDTTTQVQPNVATLKEQPVPSAQKLKNTRPEPLVMVNQEHSVQSAENAEEEELPVISVPAEPEVNKRIGEIGLFINGKEVYLNRPILLKEGQLLVPFKDVARKLYYTIIDLKNGNYRTISPQGATQEIKLTMVDGEPMISDRQLQTFFAVQTRYNASSREYQLTSSNIPKFSTYTVEKPPEEIKKESEQKAFTERAMEVPEKPSFIPAEAQPSIDLRGNATYTYIKYHPKKPIFHSLGSSLSGKFYDYRLDYGSLYKDMNGNFHHDYTWLNFVKPGEFIGLFQQYFDFYPLRLQSQSFNGIEYIRTWDYDADSTNKTYIMGGSTENTVSTTAGSVDYRGKFYGLKQEFAPLSWLGIKQALIYLQNDAYQPSQIASTQYPRENLVSYTDISARVTPELVLSSQLAEANYHPDNDTSRNVNDRDWRAAIDYSRPRFKFGTSYEYVGPDYASFGDPASYADYKGINTYGNWRVTDRWLLSTYISNYRNNVDNSAEQATVRNNSLTLSSYYTFSSDQSVNLTYNRFSSDPEGFNAGPSTVTDIGRVDYFFPFLLNTRASLNAQYSRSDQGGGASHYDPSFGGSIFRSFGRGSSWYLSHQISNTFNKDFGTADSRSSTTSFNLNYMITPLFSYYFNSNYTRNKSDDTRLSSGLSGAMGFKYQIFRDTNFGFEYNVGSYNLKTEKNRGPRDWSMIFYVSQDFNITSPPNFGIVEGVVVRDLNGNGQIDPGETPVEGVVLYLNDRRESVTDTSGHYSFQYVIPGRQPVTLDLGNIPPEWTIAETEGFVEVKARKAAHLDFILTKAVTIKGRVFVDQNGDSLYQENEEPLENIALIMSPGERFTRTNGDGEFKYDYLLPGKYTVRIHTEDLPVGYELVSSPEITSELKAGETVDNVNFVVKLTSVPVKKSP